jgi:hypothetical protein
MPDGAPADLDANYISAVERGDMASAEQSVSAAAQNSDYTQMLFHETHKDNVAKIFKDGFDAKRVGARATDSEMPDGIFLKDDAKDIGVGGANKDDRAQMRVYVKLKNPLVFSTRQDLVRYLSEKAPEYARLQQEFWRADNSAAKAVDALESNAKRLNNERAWRRYFNGSDRLLKSADIKLKDIAKNARAIATSALREGYDGIIVANDTGSRGRQTRTTIVFDPNQIKSADPITRDNSGNIIPPSKRFDSSTANIRYGVTAAAIAAGAAAAQEE